MRLDPQRAVITGIGVVACNGVGRRAFWDALAEGRSGIRFVEGIDTSEFPCKIAGQVLDFDADRFLSKTEQRRWHRATHLALAAAQLAVEDSGFPEPGYYAPERIAVGVGTSAGSLDETYMTHREAYETGGWKNMDKLASSASSGHASTACVSARFGFRGPAITIASGCSTGWTCLPGAARRWNRAWRTQR